MKFFVVLAVALVGAASAGYIPEHSHSGEGLKAYTSSQTYSSGSSGLRSIAENTASQAQASLARQDTAASQAAYQAKNVFAQAAVRSAAAAQAALSGKSVVLANLEHQYEDAEQIVESEIAQLHLSEEAASAAERTVAQAESLVHVLTSALNNAQEVLDRAQESSAKAAAETASQSEMVTKAKNRLHAVGSRLEIVRGNYEATRDAAEQANAAAEEAKSNAVAAATHASFELESSAALAAQSSKNAHEKFSEYDFDIKQDLSHY